MLGGADEKDNLINLCRQCHRYFEWLTKDDLPYCIKWNYLRKRKTIKVPSKSLFSVYKQHYEATLKSPTIEIPQEDFEFFKDGSITVSIEKKVPEMVDQYVYI